MSSVPPLAPWSLHIDMNADKKSRKRLAEDEVIDGVKFASENLSDVQKISKRELKKLTTNDGKAVEVTTDSKDKEATKREFSRPPGSHVLGGEGDMLGSGHRVVDGVTISDIKVGTGMVATKGAKLYVHCRGMLEGGVVFDDNMDGLPFVFVMGEGEVIPGWEIGLLGMRVGGERRLDIPPALCSGKEEEIPGAAADTHWVYDCMFFFYILKNANANWISQFW